MRCCVPFCRNSTENVSKTDGISFHAFPDEDSGALRAQWLRSLGMQGQVPASAAVCSQHFLREDMRDARGDRSLCAGAVPTAVQVCLICLDTDSPMISMSKYNLGEAYVHLTGYSVSSSTVIRLCNEGNLRHILCMKCAQRLTNISKFREKSLRACTLLMDLIEKYQMITPLDIAHLQSTLNSSQACCSLGSDPCDLHVLDGTSTYAQTELQLGSCLGMPQARESADRDSVDIIRQIALLDKAQFIRQLHQHHSVLRCWVKLTRISLLEDIGSFKTRAMSSFGETSLVSEDKTVPEYALQPSLASDYGAKGYCYDQSQQVFNENEIGEISNNNSQANTLQTIRTPSTNDLRSNNVSNLALKNCLVLLHDIFEESNGTGSKLDESLTEKPTAITHETNAQRKEIYTRDLSCDESTSHSEVPAQESIVNNVKVYKSHLPKAGQSGTASPNIDITLQCEEMPETNKDRYTCDTCQNDFRRECSLLKHIMLTHTEEKFFSCELCKYSTKYKNNFVLHMEAHQSEKYFACALCDFKCTIKSSLVRHFRSQTCIKSLTCKLCQYKCTTKSSFIEHKREHRLEKRFA
ncbi:uncharacterized protein LOC120625310 isoform X3 [Pararge aegeria]|nr:uncharacterized protein LOC120625310 isoform X3 [Pararge aegeria]